MKELKLYDGVEIKSCEIDGLKQFTDLSFKIIDSNFKTEDIVEYVIKIQNRKEYFYLEYKETHKNYINLNNVLHNIISDFKNIKMANYMNEPQNPTIENVISMLINDFDFEYDTQDNREHIKNTAGELLDTHNNMNRLFTIDEIKLLDNYLNKMEG